MLMLFRPVSGSSILGITPSGSKADQRMALQPPATIALYYRLALEGSAARNSKAGVALNLAETSPLKSAI